MAQGVNWDSTIEYHSLLPNHIIFQCFPCSVPDSPNQSLSGFRFLSLGINLLSSYQDEGRDSEWTGKWEGGVILLYDTCF